MDRARAEAQETLFLSSVALGVPEHELELAYDRHGFMDRVVHKSSGRSWRFVDSLAGLEEVSDGR